MVTRAARLAAIHLRIAQNLRHAAYGSARGARRPLAETALLRGGMFS